MKDNETLQRYEFKYFLPKKISDQVKIYANKFMEIDDFANINSNNNYFVRSIYFENRINSNFDEKVDGFRIRKKFRIRYYNLDLKNGPLYLETKGRNLERTYKRRTKIDLEDIDFIKNKYSLTKLINKYPNNEVINEFVFENFRKNLQPKIIIDYKRQPFVSKHGLYFRLTFDQNIACIDLENNLREIPNNNSYLCKAGYTILEVKFDRSIPAWFHRVIQTYNLKRESISKFVLGMCCLNLGKESSD